jgi:phosphoribosylanthranilate isomerase
MRRVRVKVCGLTRPEDARAAADSGVDAVGMIFYPPSPRGVDIARAERVAQAVPAFVTRVGVFVDASEETVSEVLARVPLDLLQFHGSESPRRCASAPRPYIKSIAMREGVDLEAELERYATAQALLLDTHSEHLRGGTGRSFDWSLTRRRGNGAIILAGGLDAANVAAAIEAVRPHAVDVNGGVESSPGIKDPRKIELFVSEVERVKAA